MLILLTKSEPPMFNMPVHVAGSFRKDGTYVKPHMSMRKKHIETASESRPAPVTKLGAFIGKHGGPERLRSSLAEMSAEHRAKLIDAMAHLGGVEPDAVMQLLGMHDEELARQETTEPTKLADTEKPSERGPEIVEHVTRKGKTLRGVIRRDLTQEQAKQIDEYTFRKDGGWFIRERHLAVADKLDAARGAGFLTHEQHASARAAAAKDGPAGALAALKPEAAPVEEPQASAEPTPAADAGPKEGDTKVEDGVEYLLRDGRWHRAESEPAAETQTGAAADGQAASLESESVPAAEPEPTPQPEPEAEAAQDRQDLAEELARDPHSEQAKELVRKVADRVASQEEPIGTGTFDEDDPNSPNYRYADTGHVAGSRKELAASQVIKRAKQEGARVYATAIDWDQLEQNPREAKELITKSNLFGDVDWAALREGGIEPGAGFLIDRIYAAIGQEPSVDDPQARKDYTLGLQTLRDRLEKAKTAADVTDVLDNLREEYDGKILTAEESERYQALGQEAQALYEQSNDIRKEIDALYNKESSLRAAMYPLEREIENRKRRGWPKKPELEANLSEARAAYEVAHQAWVDLLHSTKDRRETLDQQRRDLYGKRDAIVLAAAVRNKLENPLHRAWNIMGERFVNVLRYRSFKGSDAFAKHVTAAKTGKIKDWSWAEKETVRTPRVTKESARFQMKVADSFERVGGRAVAPQSTADLKLMFGLRDVQSGNWVLRDVASAKFHTEHSAAAFADLADLMGASDENIALNGRLALAFGARGHGAKGFKDGAPRAHYEPVQRVINLTKMGGGGSLGHEWFHALDNMAGEAEGAKTGAKDFFTENPDLLPAGELRDAVKALRAAMLDGPHQASRT